jgi:hypothetical protein
MDFETFMALVIAQQKRSWADQVEDNDQELPELPKSWKRRRPICNAPLGKKK